MAVMFALIHGGILLRFLMKADSHNLHDLARHRHPADYFLYDTPQNLDS
jgi:hypothetical protein